MSVAATCKDIAGQCNDARAGKYSELLKDLLGKKDATGIQTVVDHLLGVEGKTQHGRTYVTPDCLKLISDTLAVKDTRKQWKKKEIEPMLSKIVEAVRGKSDEYPTNLMKLIGLLSVVYEEAEDFKKAALTLISFKFDSPQVQATPVERVTWFVNAAEDWLECDDSGSASQQVKKAHVLLGEKDVKADLKLSFRFKTVQARVLDCERRFLDAAMRYMELAQSGSGIVSEDDLLKTLENAVTCAILAAPSPSRSRVLAMLISDQRSETLRNYNLLEKMFKERIVRSNEVEIFQKMLQTHQNAEGKGSRTVLQNSIIEHNMYAASKIYNNITFSELGVLLGIKTAEAEILAAGMIEQGRMKATIDQVDGVVEFEAATDNLRVWDEQIQTLCNSVNDVLEVITKKHPQYKDY